MRNFTRREHPAAPKHRNLCVASVLLDSPTPLDRSPGGPMDRRDFLRITAAASAGVALPTLSSRAFAQSAAAGDGWRTFEVTTRVEVLKPAGVTRIWLPTPLVVETRYQKPIANDW